MNKIRCNSEPLWCLIWGNGHRHLGARSMANKNTSIRRWRGLKVLNKLNSKSKTLGGAQRLLGKAETDRVTIRSRHCSETFTMFGKIISGWCGWHGNFVHLFDPGTSWIVEFIYVITKIKKRKNNTRNRTKVTNQNPRAICRPNHVN